MRTVGISCVALVILVGSIFIDAATEKRAASKRTRGASTRSKTRASPTSQSSKSTTSPASQTAVTVGQEPDDKRDVFKEMGKTIENLKTMLQRLNGFESWTKQVEKEQRRLESRSNTPSPRNSPYIPQSTKKPNGKKE